MWCVPAEGSHAEVMCYVVTMHASALLSCFTTYHLASSCSINQWVDLYLWHTDTVYYHFVHTYFLYKDTLTQLLYAGGETFSFFLCTLLTEMVRRHRQTLQRLLWHASHFDGEEQLQTSVEILMFASLTLRYNIISILGS